MFNKLVRDWCDRKMASRPPDVVIGGADDPYLLRWWVWKRNKWLNLYLHRVLRSDDDRALHDHPWINMSYIVEGEYSEVSQNPNHDMATGHGTPLIRTLRKAGTFKFRLPTALHRLELPGHGTDVTMPCTTLFLTGPRVRTWGFQCFRGWVKWTDFTRKTPEGAYIAEGCGDIDPSLLAPTASKSGFWPKEPDVLPASKRS